MIIIIIKIIILIKDNKIKDNKLKIIQNITKY